MATPKTKQIYQYDETLREHPTKITHIHPVSSLSDSEAPLYKSLPSTPESPLYALETTETIFYVQGGGQPPDTGEFLSSNDPSQTFQVLSVRYGLNNRVLHFGTFKPSPSASDDTPFSEGSTVIQKVNGTQRDLHSRIHTAGHVVSLAIRQLSQENKGELDVKELKAQHYPSVSFVEFTGLIDSKYKDEIQSRVDEIVRQKLPIEVTFCDVEELPGKGVIVVEGMPIVTGDGDKVRVVDIVGLGAYPCGGTHTAHTGQVRGVVVRGVKRQKGGSKISYAVVE